MDKLSGRFNQTAHANPAPMRLILKDEMMEIGLISSAGMAGTGCPRHHLSLVVVDRCAEQGREHGSLSISSRAIVELFRIRTSTKLSKRTERLGEGTAADGVSDVVD